METECFEGVPVTTGTIIDSIARVEDRLVVVLDVAELLLDVHPEVATAAR